MTIREIDDYFEKQYFSSHKKVSGKHYSPSILTSQVGTIAQYIIDNPYKRDTFYELCAERKLLIPKMLDIGYITLEDIIALINEKDDCQFLSALPDEFCEGNQQLIDCIISNKEKVVYDFLPKSLRYNSQIKECFKREKRIYYNNNLDRSGRDIEWRDKDGNLVEYFSLKGNVEITSKDDYLFIVEKYLESDMSVPAFCNAYGISSVNGFHRLLNRVAEEEASMQEDIEMVGLKTQERYLSTIKGFASKIDADELDFTSYMQKKCNYYQRFSLLCSNVRNQEKLMNQVLDYINNNQEELPNKLFSLFECGPKDFNRELVLYSSCSGVNLGQMRSFLKKLMIGYSRDYARKNINGLSGSVAGREYQIDDDIIDQALEYVRVKDIYLCDYTMGKAAKKIALGKIDYSQEVEVVKEEKLERIEALAKKLGKVTSIKEYMEVMDKENKIRM